MASLTGILSGKARKVQFIQKPIGSVLSIDCTMSETHTQQTPSTEFPLENGESVSDHIIKKPAELELNGLITDTPIKQLQAAIATAVGAVLPASGIVTAALGAALFSALSGSKSPSVAAYNQLLQLQLNGQPFDVITTLKRYSNMFIQSSTVPRDAGTGQALIFTVSLKQLLLVSPKTISIQQFSNGDLAANQANLGKQEAAQDPFKQGYLKEKADASGLGI